MSEAKWLDSTIAELKHNLNAAKRKFRENYRELKRCRTEYKTEIKNKQHDSFKDFCSSLSHKETSNLIKYLQRPNHVNRNSIPSISNPSDKGEPFSSDKKALTFILDTLAPDQSF